MVGWLVGWVALGCCSIAVTLQKYIEDGHAVEDKKFVEIFDETKHPLTVCISHQDVSRSACGTVPLATHCMAGTSGVDCGGDCGGGGGGCSMNTLM
jgi:uncharacterized membrane protein